MKPHYVVTLLAGLILILALAACDGAGSAITGSGNSIIETREISDVDSIKLEGFGELIVTAGEAETLTIEGDDNLVELVTTDVRNGQLTIGFEDNRVNIRPKSGLTFRVGVTQLEDVTIDGAGDIQLKNLKDDIDITLNGGGSIEADGNVDKVQVELNGAGTFKGNNLLGNDVSVSINGAGSAQVHANEALDASISGAGSITYSGNPDVTKSVDGLGSVSQADG